MSLEETGHMKTIVRGYFPLYLLNIFSIFSMGKQLGMTVVLDIVDPKINRYMYHGKKKRHKTEYLSSNLIVCISHTGL